MTRRRDEPRPARHGAGSSKPAPGQSRRVASPAPPRHVVLAGVLVLLIAGGVWAWSRRPAPRSVAANLPLQAVIDSAAAASRGLDHAAALRWAEALAARMPHSSPALLNLALAVNNQSLTHEPHLGVSRPVLRNSLERIEARLRTFALLDSAANAAGSQVEWLRVRQSYGESMETLGLPLDAIAAYVEVRGRAPSDAKSAGRIVWVRDRLRNPLLPDTVSVR
jgi:hypothetical protein